MPGSSDGKDECSLQPSSGRSTDIGRSIPPRTDQRVAEGGAVTNAVERDDDDHVDDDDTDVDDDDHVDEKNIRSLYTYMVLLFPHGQTGVQLKVGR